MRPRQAVTVDWSWTCHVTERRLRACRRDDDRGRRVAAGGLTTGALKSAIEVSVFCIPPSYNSLVDGNAGLPGPGAVSLPGLSQLLP